MSAEKVIFNLLKNDAGVLALVPVDRIYAGVIPQGAILPAIAYNHISTTERATVAMSETNALATSRIEVAVQTKEYPKQKQVLKAVRKACKNKRGTFAGVVVNSVLVDTLGPDMRNDDLALYMQTIDFRVTYAEPNT